MKKRYIVIIIIILAVAIFVFGNKGENNKIIDTEPPQLTINGDEKKIVAYGTDFTKDSVTATDNLDGDITEKVFVEGNVDTNNIGTYELTYKVLDSSGNTSEKKQEIMVCKPLG